MSNETHPTRKFSHSSYKNETQTQIKYILIETNFKTQSTRKFSHSSYKNETQIKIKYILIETNF